MVVADDWSPVQATPLIWPQPHPVTPLHGPHPQLVTPLLSPHPPLAMPLHGPHPFGHTPLWPHPPLATPFLLWLIRCSFPIRPRSEAQNYGLRWEFGS